MTPSPELFGAATVAGIGFFSWLGYRWGRANGWCQGYANGAATGFLQGRRSEREQGVTVPATLVNMRDIASRHQLRLAAALAGGGKVRLTIDREGYVVAFRVVREVEPAEPLRSPTVGRTMKVVKNGS